MGLRRKNPHSCGLSLDYGHPKVQNLVPHQLPLLGYP